MSSNLPPSDSPFQRPGSQPSTSQPPMGPPPSGPPAEVLEQGGGGRLPSEPRGGSGSGLRRGLFIAGGVVVATGLGVGAWAAYNFIATGPQPADALPADTLGYVSIDLDPSGGQKVEALRTLNKFPSFEEQVGIGADDDLRKSLVEKLIEEAPCDNLSYADDFEAWLGDRAAVAAVDLGEEDPEVVFVVQVTDAAAAEEGLSAIRKCGEEDDEGELDGGWVIDGDWAVISETEAIAQDVVAAAQDGSLADDEDFQRWTDEAGGDGVMTLYAGPEAGDYAADHVDELFGFGFGGGSSMECSASVGPNGEVGEETCTETELEYEDEDEDQQSIIPEETVQKFRDFAGMAMVVRFDDGAIELEGAGDSELFGAALLGSGNGGDAISTLPADTGAAFGVGFREGWFTDLLELGGPFAVGTADIAEAIEQMEEESGLELPEDAETLLGDSAVLAVGSDIDHDTFFGSEDGSDVPIVLKVQGDPEEIEKVLEKLRTSAMSSEDFEILESDSEDGVVVIGPNPDYREHILADGELGEDDVFQDVVREVDQSDVVFFVNVNELEDLIAEGLADGDDETLANLKPVSGFGATAWVDDDVAHGVLRITTD